MARQATRLRAQRPLPCAHISLACAVGAAAAITLDLSTYSRGRSSEALGDPPYRPTDDNATRNLFAFLKPQRYRSSPTWRWSNPSIDGQDPINAALVPPLKRSGNVRHTLTALPALPELSLLLRCEPCPCIPLHNHTSSSGKIRRCCVDRLSRHPESGHWKRRKRATTQVLIGIPFGPERVARFPPPHALTKLAVRATEKGAKTEQLFRTFLERLATSTWSRSSAG